MTDGGWQVEDGGMGESGGRLEIRGWRMEGKG